MIDSVYVLLDVKKGNLFYSPPATNVPDCWRNAARWDALEGNGHADDVDSVYVAGFRKSMKSVGWRAVRVNVVGRSR